MINEIKTEIIDYIPEESLAIQSLRPKARWVLSGFNLDWQQEIDKDGLPTGKEFPSNLEWFDKEQTCPSREEIDAEVSRLQALADSTKYQRQRVKEYPPLSVLADALYHQQNGDNSKMEAYLALVQAVKDKYPKP